MDELKSSHKYEITPDGAAFILLKDGGLAVCPFPPAFLQASKLTGGQPDMRRWPCNTGCPMAEIMIDETKDKMFYVTTCGCKEKINEVTPKSELVTADGAPAEKEKPIPNPLIKT